MKYFFLFLIPLLFIGCSSSTFNTAWSRTKQASYNATTDYGTWIPIAASIPLYSTNYDAKVTEYFINDKPIKINNDDLFRDINGYETYITALAIDDESYSTKTKRVLTEFTAFNFGVFSSDTLNHNIDKTSPDGEHSYAIGSQHVIGPFAGAAMTRRNVEQLNIPTWSKYTLNTISYTMATAAALTRVEEGGHSIADQLIGASVGNFIGIFFHDLIMLSEETDIQTTAYKDSVYINISQRF